jgi:beta-ribofuranosylaminobenzene 5'-phosphate synthase
LIWTVSAPARLHFGLFDLSGDLGRIDGGAGVAISEPRVVVQARTVPGGARPPPEIATLAHVLADRLRIDLSRVELSVARGLPAHVGLGSHTSLALAVGTAMTRTAGLALDPAEVAAAASRGGTSAIGVHVFRRGGLVVDGGHSFGEEGEKRAPRPSCACRAPVAPLLARYDVPAGWRFAVVIPRALQGASGPAEVSLFEESFPLPPSETGLVCRHVLLGLMPGAASSDLELVGRSIGALQRLGFKRRELALQPKPVVDLLDVMVQAGGAGAGLSSFGPTVFALAASDDRARACAAAALEHLGAHGMTADAWTTAADNHGARIELAEG